MITSSGLFMYCRTAQRMEASRGQAFIVIRDRFPEIDRQSFERVWKCARTAERLASEAASTTEGATDPP